MLGNRRAPAPRDNDEKPEPWPFDEFQKSWLVMGGDLDKFDSGSMYDFQLLKSAYCIKNGISEHEEENQVETTEDLDHLYSKIKPKKGAD